MCSSSWPCGVSLAFPAALGDVDAAAVPADEGAAAPLPACCSGDAPAAACMPACEISTAPRPEGPAAAPDCDAVAAAAGLASAPLCVPAQAAVRCGSVSLVRSSLSKLRSTMFTRSCCPAGEQRGLRKQNQI